MANAWDRLPEESNSWYGRFETYRLMGPDRTVQETYNLWRQSKGRPVRGQTSGSWSSAASRFRWKERAEAWDEVEREGARRKRQEDVDDLFENIERNTRGFYAKLTRAMAALDPATIPIGLLIPQFLAIVTKLESIYGRVSTQRVEVTGKDGAPLIPVDLDERRAVLKIVDEWERKAGLAAGGNGKVPALATAPARDDEDEDGGNGSVG